MELWMGIVFGLVAYGIGMVSIWGVAYRLGVKEGADLGYDLGYEDGYDDGLGGFKWPETQRPRGSEVVVDHRGSRR